MTAVLAEHPGPLVTFRRLVTALRLPLQGSKAVGASRHEPLPDIALPHLCNIEWAPLDDPVHRGMALRTARPARVPDPVVFGTWRASPDYGSLTVLCPHCDVKWAYGAGPACWLCGRPR